MIRIRLHRTTETIHQIEDFPMDRVSVVRAEPQDPNPKVYKLVYHGKTVERYNSLQEIRDALSKAAEGGISKWLMCKEEGWSG